MTRVLVLNGSPKGEKSNTMRLTRAFLDGAQWTNVEIINVAKVNVKGCLGCFACWNKTPGKCVIDDEMCGILVKLITADVIVWSFPLYYFSVPGELKNLIDRQLPLSLPLMAREAKSGGHPSRYDLAHQRHLVISTCGFWTPEGNYDAVIAMFDHLCGRGNYTTILCGQGELFSVPELKNCTDAYLEIIRREGEEYATGEIRAETRAKLSEPLYPRAVFEKMADASWGISEHQGSEITVDESHRFTIQMAALYKPDGLERVLEFYYTDLDKTYQILLTKQGSEVITNGFQPYTTRIETPYSLWRSISRHEISGEDALFQHLYKVIGDFSLMLKWHDLFGTLAPTKGTDVKPPGKTNMMLLLLPWITIWTAITLDSTVGSVVGIALAALVPLLWLSFRPVVFEQISIPIVIGISLAALFGVDTRLIVSASYFIFGLMWVAGAFTKIPLTAYYSASSHGGEGAFSNPLFIRTNRILTAVWGGLYLITPVWTYILLGTGFSPYLGLINSILPVLLGAFTLWFQRWYPAKYARG